jgi:hypothetical protein
VSAKGSPVFILCLGAHVELELECWPPNLAESTTVADIGLSPPSKDMVDEETGQKGKGKKPRKSKKDSVPEPSPETSANPKGNKKGKGKAAASQQKPKPTAPPHERLKINMIHGDILILSGGDFIVRCFYLPWRARR